MADSTRRQGARKPAADKPAKPYAGFPLTAHPSGKWCKKIRGRIHYFGNRAVRKNGIREPVAGDGWKEALAEYDRVSHNQIIYFINKKQMRAIDTSKHDGGRPRWRIAKLDLEAFLNCRATTPAPKTSRRQRKSGDYTRHFEE